MKNSSHSLVKERISKTKLKQVALFTAGAIFAISIAWYMDILALPVAERAEINEVTNRKAKKNSNCQVGQTGKNRFTDACGTEYEQTLICELVSPPISRYKLRNMKSGVQIVTSGKKLGEGSTWEGSTYPAWTVSASKVIKQGNCNEEQD